MSQLNNVLEDMTNALMGGLTIEDNMRAEVIKLDLENNVEKTIRLNVLKRNPIIGLFGGSNYFEPEKFSWQLSPDKPLTVNVTVDWEQPPDKEVRCTLVFLGGEAIDRGET